MRGGQLGPAPENETAHAVACGNETISGPAWREANRGHVSHAQLKVMSAIEACRTAALGGYVARCENEKCAHTVIAYCSCGNRHCQSARGVRHLPGWQSARASCCRYLSTNEATHPRCNVEGCPDRPGRASYMEGES